MDYNCLRLFIYLFTYSVDALGNDGNASMPEQVNRPNPWRKIMMMMIYLFIYLLDLFID